MEGAEKEDTKRRKLSPQLFSDLSDDQLVRIFGGEGLRFELCLVYLNFQRKERGFADHQLFGTIQASVGAGGFSTDPLLQQYLFIREFNNPIHLTRYGHEALLDRFYGSLPVLSTSVVQIASKLYVTTDKVDDVEDYTDDPEPAEPEPDDIYISPEEMEEFVKDYSAMSLKPASTVDKNGMSLEPAFTLDTNEMSLEPSFTVNTNEMSLEPASTVYTNELSLEHDSASSVEKKQDMICIDDDDDDEADNEAFHVSDGHAFINISDKPNGSAGCSILEGKHGSLEMYYVVTKYAVEAELEVKFETTNAAHTEVSGSVWAYYGEGFDYDDPYSPDDYYHAYLFISESPRVMPGRINLIRSMLSVPAKSSLIIEAKFRNRTIKGLVDIISGKSEFRVPVNCCSLIRTIVGDECSLVLKVNWKLPSEEARIRSSLNSSVSRLTDRRNFEAHSTSTTSDPDERNRWSLQKEIAKVFTTSLKRTFNLQEDVPCGISTCTEEDGGDYICASVMHIWPEIKNPRVYKGPKHAGVAVKNNIIGSDYKYMMERCVVCGPGFLKFKLHRNWIAERISTMVRVDIETWAPKLSAKKVIIYFLSEKEMHMGHLRSTFIGETLARVLEYSGVVVLRKRIHDGDSMGGLTRKRYQTVYQRLGINVKEEDIRFYESYATKVQDLVREKGLLIGSEGDELPLVELTVLWHALKEEKADRILYVSDVGKQAYIEICITAAKHVGLIENDRSTCPISHVGFGLVQGDETKSSSTKVVNLVNLLDEAESQCKALLVKQAGEQTVIEPEHAKALGYGAVKYADLKNNRLTNYTFSFDQMLNEEGNTVVNLHFTHARICSIIRNYSKDIDKLTAEALILKHDDERDLGLHLLQFTEVLGEVCTIFTPHSMCDYLYGLCKKFNSLDSSVRQVVGSSDETSKLLLCKATEVVMRKCFDLLGITPIYKI